MSAVQAMWPARAQSCAIISWWLTYLSFPSTESISLCVDEFHKFAPPFAFYTVFQRFLHWYENKKQSVSGLKLWNDSLVSAIWFLYQLSDSVWRDEQSVLQRSPFFSTNWSELAIFHLGGDQHRGKFLRSFFQVKLFYSVTICEVWQKIHFQLISTLAPNVKVAQIWEAPMASCWS